MKFLGTFFLLLNFNVAQSQIHSIETIDLPVQKEEIHFLFASAKKEKLESSRQWLKLIHIERNFIGLKKTQVTDPKFLLKNRKEFAGYTELEATLAAFFDPAEKFAERIEPFANSPKHLLDSLNKVVDHSNHAICKFPARLKFLRDKLSNREANLIWSRLPLVSCGFQKVFKELLDPSSISYVFSSYYADSPGSAFGHTFFRINKKSKNTVHRQELLDYGVGFAANMTTTNPFAYAILGIFGGFSGTWTNLPYYYKVREYNDYEARDLWSYELALTSDELEMFILHLWEIGSHSYSYYFFTQNCSFHMLTALEAAAPRLNLIDHVPFYYVIPADSLKALFYENNFVGKVSYRPSLRKVFMERLRLVDSSSVDALKQFVKNLDSSAFDNVKEAKQKALVIDAAIDYFDMKFPAAKNQKDLEKMKTKESLLIKRANINFISPELKLKLDPKEDPSQSHGSSRLALSLKTKDTIKTGFLGYRFALHDLLDSSIGLPPNSQLEYFGFNFELKPNDFKFSDGNIFKIFNVNPIKFFENKASWGADLGVKNKSKYCLNSEYACYLYGSQVKYGYSFNLLPEDYKLMFWGLGTVNLGHMPQRALSNKFYFAPGFEFGLLYQLSDSQRLFATFGREYPQKQDFDQSYNVEYRISFKEKIGLGANVQDDLYGASFFYYY